MSRRVFITGATGFVGGAVLRHLVARGDDVTALARSRTGAEQLAAGGAQPVFGDVLDGAVLRGAMAGAEVVFHVAGVNAMCPDDPDAMWRVNVDGVRAVVEAAAAAGVGRVVHTSSAATIGEPRGTIGREDTPHRGRYLSHYERTKHQGELAAFEAGSRFGIDVVAVNPSSVQGPGRSRGSARLLTQALNAPVALAMDTTVSIVDVDDCAAGHLIAAERGTPGERYLLSGSSVGAKRLLDLIETVGGRRVRAIVLPRPVVAAVGYPAAWLAGRRRGDGEGWWCLDALRTVLHGHRFDGGRAVRELGISYTPLEETLRRTLTWLREYGLVRRELPALER